MKKQETVTVKKISNLVMGPKGGAQYQELAD
jgi:hypothetical protein